MAVVGPLLDRLDLEAGGVDDGFVLVRVDRAYGVDDRAARADALGRGAQELELQLGQRAGAPAQVRAAREDAGAGAGRVEQGAVEAGLVERARVGVDDADVAAPGRLEVDGQLARAALVQLDGNDLIAAQQLRLPAGRRAQVDDAA